MTDLASLLATIDRPRLVRRFGKLADAWCADLPDLVASLASAWGLRVDALLPAGSNSVVLACESGDGDESVLKLTPDVSVAAHEAIALTAWSGSAHVVGLLDHDAEAGALLLERIRPGLSLADDPDGWTVDELAPMLSEIMRPPPAADELPRLTERVDLVFELAGRRLRQTPAVAALIGPTLLERSRARCRALATDKSVGMIHGDLHPANVLRADGDDRVVAIDPRPCRGDSAVDAVDWMLSDVLDERGLERRVAWLADNVDHIDADRVWAWCEAMAVIVAASMLVRRQNDPVGRFLLAFAGAADLR